MNRKKNENNTPDNRWLVKTVDFGPKGRPLATFGKKYEEALNAVSAVSSELSMNIVPDRGIVIVGRLLPSERQAAADILSILGVSPASTATAITLHTQRMLNFVIPAAQKATPQTRSDVIKSCVEKAAAGMPSEVLRQIVKDCGALAKEHADTHGKDADCDYPETVLAVADALNRHIQAHVQ